MMNTFQNIYRIVEKIPYGKVATYGQIACMAGNPRGARVVGYALHVAPRTVPCHRVVNRFGELSDAFLTEGENLQKSLLEHEGVCFLKDGKVDLKRHLWTPGL